MTTIQNYIVTESSRQYASDRIIFYSKFRVGRDLFKKNTFFHRFFVLILDIDSIYLSHTSNMALDSRFLLVSENIQVCISY